MDWKYKHFHGERIFPAEHDTVVEAARNFMSSSLGWSIADTGDGLTAQGYSFSHRAIANFTFQPVASGTKVLLELLVERVGFRGYMLFDVGGYYYIQMRKWLDGIQWMLHQPREGKRDESTNPLVIAQHKPSAYLFHGCLALIVIVVALYFLATIISAVVGLVSGSLFLVGSKGTLIVHGIFARVLSALILLFVIFVVLRVKHKV